MKGEPLEHGLFVYGKCLPFEGEAVPKGQASAVVELAYACGESFQESRMREIRTSGSMRGE